MNVRKKTFLLDNLIYLNSREFKLFLFKKYDHKCSLKIKNKLFFKRNYLCKKKKFCVPALRVQFFVLHSH